MRLNCVLEGVMPNEPLLPLTFVDSGSVLCWQRQGTDLENVPAIVSLGAAEDVGVEFRVRDPAIGRRTGVLVGLARGADLEGIGIC
jgi:hypothetical protein